jgi:hypothetical protein
MLWCENARGKKQKSNENLKATSQVEITVDQRQPENVEFFSYLGSMITNNARHTRENKSKIVKATFDKKKALFNHKLDSDLRKKK